MPIPQQTLEGWTIAARRNPRWQHPKEQEAITIISRLIGDETLPEDSATRLASAYEPWLKSGETDPDGIWSVFINAIITFGGSIEALERLVIMTRSLALQPDVLDKDGKAITPHNLKRVFWRDLPFFGMSFQEDIFGMLIFILTVLISSSSFLYLQTKRLLDTLEEDVIEDNRSQIDWDVEVTTYTHGNLFAAL